jgi:hypothetical protein
VTATIGCLASHSFAAGGGRERADLAGGNKEVTWGTCGTVTVTLTL